MFIDIPFITKGTNIDFIIKGKHPVNQKAQHMVMNSFYHHSQILKLNNNPQVHQDQYTFGTHRSQSSLQEMFEIQVNQSYVKPQQNKRSNQSQDKDSQKYIHFIEDPRKLKKLENAIEFCKFDSGRRRPLEQKPIKYKTQSSTQQGANIVMATKLKQITHRKESEQSNPKSPITYQSQKCSYLTRRMTNGEPQETDNDLVDNYNTHIDKKPDVVNNQTRSEAAPEVTARSNSQNICSNPDDIIENNSIQVSQLNQEKPLRKSTKYKKKTNAKKAQPQNQQLKHSNNEQRNQDIINNQFNSCIKPDGNDTVRSIHQRQSIYNSSTNRVINPTSSQVSIQSQNSQQMNNIIDQLHQSFIDNTPNQSQIIQLEPEIQQLYSKQNTIRSISELVIKVEVNEIDQEQNEKKVGCLGQKTSNVQSEELQKLLITIENLALPKVQTDVSFVDFMLDQNNIFDVNFDKYKLCKGQGQINIPSYLEEEEQEIAGQLINWMDYNMKVIILMQNIGESTCT